MAKVSIKDSKGNFETCPEYTGKAVCVDVTPLKKQMSQYGEREVFRFVFEIEENRSNGEPFCVWSSGFTLSLHEKAGLRKFLRGWLGRDLTAQELEDFDTECMLGKPAFLVITHTTKENETYANIASCTPDKTPGGPLTPSGKFIRAKDREGSGSEYKKTNGNGNGTNGHANGSEQSADPAIKFGKVKIHVGKAVKGMQLADCNHEQIAPIIEHWLPTARTNAQAGTATADDKRLVEALDWYQRNLAPKATTPAEDDVPY